MKRFVAAGGLVTVLMYACAATRSDPFAAAIGGTGGQDVDGGTRAGGGSANAARGGSGLIVVPDASDDVMIEPDAACGIGTAQASLRPVSMFVMFDRSMSMIRAEPDPVTMMNRWEMVLGVLKSFFADPGAEGLGVALRFFPDDRPVIGCIEVDCNPAACAVPLVDIGTLTAAPAPEDQHEAALVDAVEASTPRLPPAGEMARGGTPTSVALDGALTWAAAHQALHVEGRTVVLFVTDGQPAGCDQRIAAITAIAESARRASGVATYAVGLTDAMGEGLKRDDMNALAVAGGTERAFFIQDGPTAAEELLATLSEIRGLALPCDFPMPEATSSGLEIDPRLVNVTYTSGDGTETQFTKVPGAGDCGASRSWYYDDEDNPTRVVLCPSACDTVSTDTRASFEILVGCAPVVEPPR